MCFRMLKIAAILSQLDIFEKFPTKIKNKKRITNYFARKVIINDLKTWVFAEINAVETKQGNLKENMYKVDGNS